MSAASPKFPDAKFQDKAADKAHEPSMEEILASIRRIIADDQAAKPVEEVAAPEPDDVLDLAEVAEPVVRPRIVTPEPAPSAALLDFDAIDFEDPTPVEPEPEAAPEPPPARLAPPPQPVLQAARPEPETEPLVSPAGCRASRARRDRAGLARPQLRPRKSEVGSFRMSGLRHLMLHICRRNCNSHPQKTQADPSQPIAPEAPVPVNRNCK